MATAEVLCPLAIPGLHQQPTHDDLCKSGDIYNTLPNDADQPQGAEAFISGLKLLIKEFKVQNKFGLHLVHSHVKMATGIAMIRQSMTTLPGIWTRPRKVDTMNLGELRGYIFVLGTDNIFHPYEYREGPTPMMNANDNAFITAAQTYLQQHNLTSLVGVELLSQDSLGKHMKEFVLSDSDGTVMLPANAVNPTETYRTTGWNAVEGVTEFKGKESSHAKTTKATHQVFIDGKALPDLENSAEAEEIIMNGLRDAGIVN